MSDELAPVPARPNINAAISWSFDTFKRNPVPFIALAAVVAVIQMVQQIASAPIQNALTACTDAQSPGQVAACKSAVGSGVLVGAVVTIVFVVLAYFATIGVLRAAIATSHGAAPEFSMIVRTEYLGRYVLFSLLYGVLAVIGVILCIIPGLLVAFFLQLGQVYVLDRGDRPVAAAKSSFAAVRRHIGPALLMLIFVMIVALIGSTFYGILTLVTLPFSSLFIVHMYRQFNGEPVA